MSDSPGCEGITLSRQSFLGKIGTLTPADSLPDDWSHEQIEKASSEMLVKPVGTGMYDRIPRNCKGDGCVDADICPLTKYPQGRRCPIEAQLVDRMLAQFTTDLHAENDLTTFSLIRDLVDVEIQIMRKHATMSDDPSFLTERNIYSAEGELIATEMVESPMVSIDDRLTKRKQIILKQLAATREQRLKLIGDSENRSEISRVASIMSRVAKALESKGGMDQIDDDEEIVDSFLVEELPEDEEE